MRGVPKYESADEDSALAPAQNGVPHRGGVARALDPQPRPWRQLLGAGDALCEQLAVSGDPSRVRVDEEHAHDSRQ